MAGKYNDGKVNEDEAFFISRNDLINRWGNIVSSWAFLPGLVGLWPMSSVQRSTGNAYDMSGQSRVLTSNDNVTYNIYNNFVPYVEFDGNGDYLSRADETDLDILGTEVINAAAVRGLTMGGWFWFDTIPNFCGLMSKYAVAGNQRSYLLAMTPASTVYFIVSTNGIATVTSPLLGVTTASWYFIVGRYIPSSAVTILVNAVPYTTAAGVPASLFNSTAQFAIGYGDIGALYMDGRASLCFLSHQAFSNALINAMFQQSRILFGV